MYAVLHSRCSNVAVLSGSRHFFKNTQLPCGFALIGKNGVTGLKREKLPPSEGGGEREREKA